MEERGDNDNYIEYQFSDVNAGWLRNYNSVVFGRNMHLYFARNRRLRNEQNMKQLQSKERATQYWQ